MLYPLLFTFSSEILNPILQCVISCLIETSQIISISFMIVKFSRHKKLINDYIIYYGGNRLDFKRDT